MGIAVAAGVGLLSGADEAVHSGLLGIAVMPPGPLWVRYMYSSVVPSQPFSTDDISPLQSGSSRQFRLTVCQSSLDWLVESSSGLIVDPSVVAVGAVSDIGAPQPDKASAALATVPSTTPTFFCNDSTLVSIENLLPSRMVCPPNIYTIYQSLTWCQFTFLKFPAFDVTESVATEVCPVELGDGVAEGGEGAADLAVAAFAHLNNPAVVVALVLTFQRQAAGTVR